MLNFPIKANANHNIIIVKFSRKWNTTLLVISICINGDRRRTDGVTIFSMKGTKMETKAYMATKQNGRKRPEYRACFWLVFLYGCLLKAKKINTYKYLAAIA